LKERNECNVGSFEVLSAVGNLSFGTSMSPVAGNQVQENQWFQFFEPMSKPTNEPTGEPIKNS
jgi:hypothetical protein